MHISPIEEVKVLDAGLKVGARGGGVVCGRMEPGRGLGLMRLDGSLDGDAVELGH